MKSKLLIFALAALTIGLLGSCSKMNERIDDLNQRVGNIEQEKIASIGNQIASINSSIADLGIIRKDIVDLQVAVGAKGADITDLKAADNSLGQKINELKEYVGDLSKYAEKDWVTAAFATLKNLETIKTELETLKESLNNQGKTFDDKLSELSTKLTNSINSAINGVKSTISTLESRVSALEKMIQTVVIVPAYSDGSVKVENDTLTIDCIITPKEAVSSLKKNNFAVLTNEVLTKSVSIDTIIVDKDEDLVIDRANGTATIKVDVSSVLPTGKALTVAVSVKNGISDYTTEFVPAKIPVSVSLDKHSICMEKVASATDIQLAATVIGTSKGVHWGTTGHYTSVDGTGKVTVSANVIGKDTVVVTTVEGAKTDTCFVFIGCVEIGGINWATMNLGATTVAGSLSTCAGDYYQWGSVNTLYNDIPWSTWSGTGNFVITSWKAGKSDGFVPNNREYIGTDSILPDDNDVVMKEVGDGWRMPTFDNFNALYDACINVEYDKTTYASAPCGNTTNFAKGIYWCGNYDGVAGCLFCDGTNKVFFPAAGQGGNSSAGDGPKTLMNPNKIGIYWSSTLCSATGGVPTSYILNFASSIARTTYGNQGQYGGSIRPVKD